MTGVGLSATPAVEAPTPERWGRQITGRDLLVAGLVALVATTVALVFRSAIVPTDPWHYVQGALTFPEPTWRPAGLTRWGFLLPIIPFARMWGDAEATYYAVPLISTGALAAILYLLGTRYVARTVGILGAVLALSTPLVFVNLTRGYTDLTATTLVGAAILLATLAEDAARAARQEGTGWGWRVPALLLATGLVTGWSFEVRETAIFTWPVVAWILWRVGDPLRTLTWFAPPALAWLLLDLWLCGVVYDDPFAKFSIILGADISASEVTSDAGYVGQSRWWYATILPRSIWQLSGGPALLVSLGVGIVGGVVFRAQLGRIAAWGMLALGLLWAQGGPLDPGHPSVRLDVARYWLSFIVPLMLAAAGTLVIVVRRSRGGWQVASAAAGTVLALSIMVPAIRFSVTYPGFSPNGGRAMAELRDHLTATGGVPQDRIWADWGTQRVLPTYQRGPFGDLRWSAQRFRSLNRLLREDERSVSRSVYPGPGDYVVLYSTQDRTCWHCRRALEPVEEAFGPMPASGWELLFTASSGNLALYRLGERAQWPERIDGVEVDAEAGAADSDPDDDGAGGDDGGEDDLGL